MVKILYKTRKTDFINRNMALTASILSHFASVESPIIIIIVMFTLHLIYCSIISILFMYHETTNLVLQTLVK